MNASHVLVTSSVLWHLITEVTLSLGFINLVVLTPSDFDTYDVIRGAWSLGVTTEMHLDPHYVTQGVREGVFPAPVTNKNSSTVHKLKSLWSRTDWTFLCGREPLPRHSMAVLVVGPSDWVCMATVQMDTLMLAPVGGKILARDLCPSIPLAVRLVLLEELNDKEGTRKCKGVLREARLADGGSYKLRTVACLYKDHLHYTASIFRPITSLKGSRIKVSYSKAQNEMLGDMLENFMKKLNFTMEISESNGPMNKMPNGSFNGPLGLIQRREVDVLVKSVSMLPERTEVVDYSEWFWLYSNKFYTKVPELVKDSFLLWQIYTWQTWCVICGFLILASTMLALTWNATPSGTETTAVSVQTAVTTVLKTVVYVGSKQQPPDAAGRLVLTSTWLVAIILVALYTGNLTAFLSIPRVEKLPQTVKEMIDMGYDFSISYGYSQYEKLKTFPSKDHQYLFHRAVFRLDEVILIEEKYIQMVLKQRISLIVTGPQSLILLDQYAKSDGPVKICTLKQSSEVIYTEIVSIAFPKNSPIKHLFDNEIIWLRSSHLINFTSPKCVFANLRNEELASLDLVKLGGVMVVWAVGVQFACLLFLAEILYFNVHLCYG